MDTMEEKGNKEARIMMCVENLRRCVCWALSSVSCHDWSDWVCWVYISRQTRGEERAWGTARHNPTLLLQN